VTAQSSKIVPPTPGNLAAAGRHIRAGRLVAFPTETVYGLGGDATNDRAVAAIFEAKGRPGFNPLIVHFPDRHAAAAPVRFDARANTLAEAFWPGALTLVLPRREPCPISLLVSAGLETVAVRVPAHEVALRLLEEAGRPIAAPSANPSGAVSPTTAAHVAETLAERVAMILDGGRCAIGLESTVVDLSGPEPRLLRPGGVGREEIEAVIGPLRTPRPPQGRRAPVPSPGMLERHYAPRLPLRLDVDPASAQPRPGEALLAFGPNPPAGFAAMMNLSPAGDLGEAAANFFAMLRALDEPRFSGIAVMPIPEAGLGAAINDRLRRAGAPRSVAREAEAGQIG
jgi:L-threonylcarbamoyladenylate synthase